MIFSWGGVLAVMLWDVDLSIVARQLAITTILWLLTAKLFATVLILFVYGDLNILIEVMNFSRLSILSNRRRNVLSLERVLAWACQMSSRILLQLHTRHIVAWLYERMALKDTVSIRLIRCEKSKAWGLRFMVDEFAFLVDRAHYLMACFPSLGLGDGKRACW